MSDQSGSILGPINFTGASFTPTYCFDHLEPEKGYNVLYCVNNTMILAGSVVNLLLVIYLTFLHFKAGMRQHTCSELMCKVKSTILIMLILFELILIYRYGLIIETQKGNKAYYYLLDIQQFVNSIIFFQICYFYAKKAAHYIPDNEKVLKIMRLFMYVNLATFLGFMIWQFTAYNETKSACRNLSFIFAAFFNQLANAFFMYIGYRVYHSVMETNNQQRELLSDGHASHEENDAMA